MDAYTVSSSAKEEKEVNLSTENDDGDENLEQVYASIRANKEDFLKGGSSEFDNLFNDDDQNGEDERPDPGFRIFHVDEETGEQREVPPYTSPGEFLERIKKEKLSANGKVEEDVAGITNVNAKSNGHEEAPSQTPNNTFDGDGYSYIQKANSRSSRAEELKAMRAARQQNRREETEENKIGVYGQWTEASSNTTEADKLSAP